MITFNQDILWVDHVQPQPDLAKVVGLNSLLAVQAQSVPGGFKNLRVVQLKHQSLWDIMGYCGISGSLIMES